MEPDDIRRSTKEALKTVYYIIIGLAIIQALSRTFLIEGSFIGWQVFSKVNLSTTLLLFALFPTVCRFVHGASIHLGISAHKRFKPIIDFIGFLLQASLFYMMAISLGNPRAFIMAYVLMLFVDSLWLILLGIIRYHRLRFTEIEWLISDVIIIIVFIFFYFLYRDNPAVWIVWSVMLVSLAAAFTDYILNRNFYFPKAE